MYLCYLTCYMPTQPSIPSKWPYPFEMACTNASRARLTASSIGPRRHQLHQLHQLICRPFVVETISGCCQSMLRRSKLQ